MKKSFLIAGISLLLLVAACVPTPATTEATSDPILASTQTEAPTTAPTAEPETPGLTVEMLENLTYFAPYYERTVQLTNGAFSEKSADSEYAVTLLPQIAMGDLNSDGIDDAVILLNEDRVGVGNYVSIAVVASNEGQFTPTNSILIDKRPILTSLSIVDGEILLEATIHYINDPMDAPSLAVKWNYRLLENTLTLMSQNSALSGNQERFITIEAPADGSEVASTMQITGSMAIAPFENNLRLAVYDMAGTLLYETGFMVTATDMGMPATFDSSVTIPGLASGSWVRLELAELSMADGSIMTSNSTVVKIK